METNIEYTVNLPNTIQELSENCRMCLEGLGEFISMDSAFETSSTLGDSTYLDAFNFCTNLNANTTDDLPQMLCIDCSDNLKFIFDVLKRAQQSDDLLREIQVKQIVIENLPADDQEFIEKQELSELPDKNVEQKHVVNDDDCPDNDMEELIYLEEHITHWDDDETSSRHEFPCDLCEEVFPTENDMVEHIVEHSDNRLQESEDDSNEFPQSSEVLLETSKEQPRQQPPKNIICEICGKCFTTKQKLRAHHLVHTKEKNFQCELCPKRYPNAYLYRDHMKVHANIRSHGCSYCKKKFFSKNTLVCHMRSHTGERPFKCQICGKSFTQSSIMRTHEALHTGKTVECPLCSKKFSRSSHLILHQRSHTGERPYVCHLCSNSYKQKSHLDRHLDTHMGVKHTCEICGKEYTKKSSLTSHMFVHAAVKPFKCDECQMGFSTKEKYQRHLKKAHKAAIKVEVLDGTAIPEENIM